jgi:putative phosphoribosyl transferase
MNSSLFLNRKEAGELLADRLAKYLAEDPLVLALPRGGIPVAYEVANTLGTGLSALIVQKIGSPAEPELAIGAIGEESVTLVDDDLIQTLGLQDEMPQLIEIVKQEVDRKLLYYRDNRGLPPFNNKTVIIVDDGLATGLTGAVAVQIAKNHQAKKIVLALPVCSQPAAIRLADITDDLVCLETLADLTSIGSYYYDFSQVSDDEALGLIKSANAVTLTNLEPDLPSSPEEEGEQMIGGSMVGPEADDDVEKMARIAGIKTNKVHR